MRNCVLLFILLISGVPVLFAQDTLKIQEDTLGLCTYDGVVMTNLSGWTGRGYIDIGYNAGAYISYEINVPVEGRYSLVWRYAFNGTARDARLVINGNRTGDTVYFPSTGSSSSWQLSAPVNVSLAAGDNKIRIEALYGTINSGGLGNLDYFMIIGNTPAAITCSPQYTINVSSNDTTHGTVSYTPIQNYYDKGTQVTFSAQAKPGYFFESWTGEETSNETTFGFTVTKTVNDIARFLPNGITPDISLAGYAGTQDDSGTTYMVFGGALGDTVTASTLSDLQTYLGDPNPHVVKFSGELIDNAEISIKSNKTLLGIGTAHLHGIELSINQSRNIIVKNITLSKVRDTLNTNDAFEINGGSKNILIDHCEFYSDRDHDKDYYDGLLDIKNGSSFITVSWTALHDHFKACLISSGPEQNIDTVARLTFHHNYFYNCGSRLPSIRFGKAHVYNNYFKDCDDAVHSRIGAWVRVEGNYFDNVGNAVATDDTSGAGYVQLIDNHFGSSSVTSNPVCDLQVPYPYILDPTDSIPGIITKGAATEVADLSPILQPDKYVLEQNYPNPFNPVTVIHYRLPAASSVKMKIFDLLGREVATLVNTQEQAGDYSIQFDATRYTSGVYFYRLTAGAFTQVRKMLLLK
jgi:pectate lyase